MWFLKWTLPVLCIYADSSTVVDDKSHCELKDTDQDVVGKGCQKLHKNFILKRTWHTSKTGTITSEIIITTINTALGALLN